MKKYNYYLLDFQDQANTKIIRREESFTVVTDDDDEEHIFSAEYLRKVIR